MNLHLPTLIAQIEERIAALPDTHDRSAARAKLANLQQNPAFATDPYFYKELHDDLLALQTTRVLKVRMSATLAEVDAKVLHPSLQSEHDALAKTAKTLLSRRHLNESEVASLCAALGGLVERSQARIADEFVAEREREFLRRQLVATLVHLGYEVAEDSATVDFGKVRDVLLRNPDQDNLVHLEFKDDGRICHRFLIPEHPDELGQEAKEVKVEEMQASCRTFQAAINRLRDLGLELPFVRERPASTEALMQVPERHKAALRKASKHRRAEAPVRSARPRTHR